MLNAVIRAVFSVVIRANTVVLLKVLTIGMINECCKSTRNCDVYLGCRYGDQTGRVVFTVD